MTIRYGSAESNEGTGFRLTVESPDGTTAAAPVLPGQIFKLGGTDADGGGYKLVALADEDTMGSVVMVQASERKIDVGPMTVNVISPFAQVRRVPYLTGSAPTIGQSLKVSATVTKLEGKAFDGDGYVLYVDTDNEEVEVLS